MGNNTDIRTMQPLALWNNFYQICQIPHPSGFLSEISTFIIEFAKKKNLEFKVDNVGNILIKKPATLGKENVPVVVLQSHLDMVPQKNSDVNHNFEKDSLSLIVEDDWLKATQTTLGADNGIGVAATLAILESNDLSHGPIEALFTIDEEVGMIGAKNLNEDSFEGKILLNMDSEDEGELFVGCAGGVDANITFKYNEVAIPNGDIALEIKLSGLKGGHSGLEINCGRANAIKLMFRFLKESIMLYEARLSSIESGNMRNAIPREATATITIPAEGLEEISNLVQEYEQLFNEEYKSVEEKISFTAKEIDLPQGLIPEEIQDDLVNSITACPNGVFRFIPEIPDTVETSNNLSIVKSDGENIFVASLIRSAMESKKEELASMVESLFLLAGAKVDFSGNYPGWSPDMNSKIMTIMSNVYAKKFGKRPEVKVIHAGLECGIIGAKKGDIDMISFGPTIRHPHSPDEKVSISSVQRFWNFLISTLEEIK
ncbi:MAG: aminoacyl-histidine dipeptidase [Paludibacteraceae bacterium]|nr:aminoacyl-histidine dipeptidase [Paludibacteraceae bacterium]